MPFAVKFQPLYGENTNFSRAAQLPWQSHQVNSKLKNGNTIIGFLLLVQKQTSKEMGM